LITALVEQNHVHMDDADTAVVLAALEELGVQAEATEQTTVLKAALWVLTLHWIGDDLPHLGFEFQSLAHNRQLRTAERLSPSSLNASKR
jgi:hypothetical protein